jgi:hypothetical protein
MALDRSAAGPISPITVQRDEFDAALSRATDQSKLDFNELATALVTTADKLKHGSEDSDKVGASGTDKAATTTAALKARENKALHKLTPEEQAEKDKVEDLEQQQKDAEAMHQWERKRAKVRLPPGKSMRDLMKGRTF